MAKQDDTVQEPAGGDPADGPEEMTLPAGEPARTRTGSQYIDMALQRLGFEDDDVEDFEEYVDEAPDGPEVQKAPAPVPHRTAAVRPHIPWPVLLAPALLAVIILAVVALIAFSTADVTITTKTESVDLPILIVAGGPAVAAEGQVSDGLNISGAEQVPAKRVDLTITQSGETPVFGSVTLPDQTATGEVRVTNPYPTTITIPAGTEVGVVRGISYATTEDVTVEAGDPFGSMSYGSATIPVAASKPGSEGNIPERSLVGQLANGVYYLNENPVSGGTDKQVPAVSDDDRTLLRKNLEDKVRSTALDSLKGSLKAGQQLIGPSLSFDDWQAEFDHGVGDQADKVHLTLKARVSGLVYSTSDIDQAVAKAVERNLNKRDTGAAKRSVEKLTHSTLQLMQEDPEKAVFQTEVQATVHYALDPAMLAKIRADITGKPVEEANQYLSALPYMKSYSLARNPDWFPWDRLPASQDKITVKAGS